MSPGLFLFKPVPHKTTTHNGYAARNTRPGHRGTQPRPGPPLDRPPHKGAPLLTDRPPANTGPYPYMTAPPTQTGPPHDSMRRTPPRTSHHNHHTAKRKTTHTPHTPHTQSHQHTPTNTTNLQHTT